MAQPKDNIERRSSYGWLRVSKKTLRQRNRERGIGSISSTLDLNFSWNIGISDAPPGHRRNSCNIELSVRGRLLDLLSKDLGIKSLHLPINGWKSLAVSPRA